MTEHLLNYYFVTMVKAKVYIFEKQFDGWPKESDLKLIEEELPAIKDGEFLAEAIFLSVDPYMRAYAPYLPVGIPFIGSQVAKILESKNPKYPVGAYVVGQYGWRTHTVTDGQSALGLPETFVLPDFGDIPLSYALGILGMPGNTAYFGFLELLKPKKGETLIVTGAAGAVGSIVGQLGKIRGCTVIGVSGSEEKGKWLVNELGFDHYINYKTDDLDKVIPKLVPNGIDLYFDNVGGEISSTILKHMNHFGRISVCGGISGYNEKAPKATMVQFSLIMKELKMEGFQWTRWKDRALEGILQNKEWIHEGKLKYRETITDGFENMFKAFVDMLRGGNSGKAVVKV